MNFTEFIMSGPIIRAAAALQRFLEGANKQDQANRPPPNSSNLSVGRHTYGLKRSTISSVSERTKVEIGNYCSFAPGVQILAHVDHPTMLPSTYPFRSTIFRVPAQTSNKPANNADAVSKGSVTIGHDVWLGCDSIILSGVTIGTGAVVGAGAIVTKDVPPYAIVVGNPARLVRYRFEPEIVEMLLQSNWWDLPADKLRMIESDLYDTNIEKFLTAVSRLRQAASSLGKQDPPL